MKARVCITIVLCNCISQKMRCIISYNTILYYTQHAIGRNLRFMTCQTLAIHIFVALRLEYGPKTIPWTTFVLSHRWYTHVNLCTQNDKETTEFVLHIYHVHAYRWIRGWYNTTGIKPQSILHTPTGCMHVRVMKGCSKSTNLSPTTNSPH